MSSGNYLPLLQQQFTLWTDLALKTAEMLVASGQVIGHRSGRMAAAGPVPSPRDQREFVLMGQEKFDAATAAATAMGLQWLSIGSSFGMQVWRDLIDAACAALALASSRTVQEAIDRQAELMRALTRSAVAAGRLGNAGPQIAGHGLKPIHAAATANARRLGRG